MDSFRQLIQFDPQLGHRYVPNQNMRVIYGNSGFFIKTDNLGFRNDYEVTDKTAAVALGDSFLAGDGVSNDQRFTDQLQHQIGRQILNLGVSGYGIDQQILAYETVGKRFDHEVVIFAPHLDDMRRNLLESRIGFDKNGNRWMYPKPFFELVDNELILRNVPVPREYKASDAPRPVQPVTPQVQHQSKLRQIINHLYIRYLFEFRNLQQFPEFSDHSSDVWTLMSHLLNRLIALTEGKQLFIMPIPYNSSFRFREKPLFLELFRNFESPLVKILDITKPLYGKNNLFLPLCKHFTPYSHGLIAKYLARQIAPKNAPIPKTTNTPKNECSVFVLGISCFYHDSSAALLGDGKVLAAAQEERFTRVKNDNSFPMQSINFCLEQAGISINQLSAIVYYDNPYHTLERNLHVSFLSGQKNAELWDRAKKRISQKFQLPTFIKKSLDYQGKLYYSSHHLSHAASAYFSSPFDKAAFLVVDAVGEWASSSFGVARQNTIKTIKEQRFPNSIGLLYSAITSFCGFEVNSGEYKLMGLAPYGHGRYCSAIKEKLLQIAEDGSVNINLKYFDFSSPNKIFSKQLQEFFEVPERQKEQPITQVYCDIAKSIQTVLEEVILKMAKYIRKTTGEQNLVFAGGVALNCVANGILIKESGFSDIYFFPAAGDAGTSIGAAQTWYFERHQRTHKAIEMPFYGPSFSDDEIKAALDQFGLPYSSFQGNRSKQIAEWLVGNKKVGYFNHRMEFGPRALGARSILANPLDPKLQSELNRNTKQRESFRPFAPIYLEEKTAEYFDFDRPSPFMQIAQRIASPLMITVEQKPEDLAERLNQKRSPFPAATHVDYSSRLQSVNQSQCPDVYEIIKEFGLMTGWYILINTSFNVNDEPIVCTPSDAIRCFKNANLDVLVLGDFYTLSN